jgi:hypothetical protein
VKTRVYTEQEAEIYGKRRVCYGEGHEFESNLERMSFGGVQMDYDRNPGEREAACDSIRCKRCDAIVKVTYPEIGTVVK